MSISQTFIERPVATSLVMAGIVLIGVVSFRQLPVSALPQVDYPTMQIQTFYPGASPEVVTSSITAPLEKQIRSRCRDCTQMTSISSFGSSLITLQFSLDLSICGDIAEQESHRPRSMRRRACCPRISRFPRSIARRIPPTRRF